MKTACLFPGQGSQSVGMLEELDFRLPLIAQYLDKASKILDLDLGRIVRKGPAEELDDTERTQPALFTVSAALFDSLDAERRKSLHFLAGHSLGEYSALYAAGSLDFADGVKLVRKRGQLMKSAVSGDRTGMAAVLGLADDQVVDCCQSLSREGHRIEAVNFNCPGQVVVAGHEEALQEASAALKAAGARRILPLSVSVPSHSSLMRPAAEQLAEVLAEVKLAPPSIPVLQNVDAQATDEPQTIRENLVRQLYSPVLWTQTLDSLKTEGVTDLMECGPGKVLAGLVRKFDRKLNIIALSEPAAWS